MEFKNKMKKVVIALFFVFNILFIFAEEHLLVKLAEYEQNPESGMFIRPYQDITPQDDYSNDYLFISESGYLYCYQVDNSILFKISDDYSIIKESELKLWKSTYVPAYYDKTLLICDLFSRIYLYRNDYKKFAYIDTYDLLGTGITGNNLGYCYYDEQCDVLFFRDDNSNLYSIEHPSMDEAENQANFKGPAETIEMLKSGIYAPHLSTNQYKELCVDGNFYFWEGKLINGKRYQLFSENQVKFYPTLKRDGMIDFIFKVPYGDVESIAIHPCGDLYMLGINWNTNTHILYRVENTWDLEWRFSWYAEHPDAPGKALFGE